MRRDRLRLGLLTVGQSPREDVTPTLRAILGESVHLRESGALDGLTEEDLRALAPHEGETPLETWCHGGAVVVAEERLMPRLQAAADRLERLSDLTLLLCSGEFPELTLSHPGVVQPVHMLRGAVRALCAGGVLGIVGPESDMSEAPGRWQEYATTVITAAASPYAAITEVRVAVADLVDRGATLVFLNDMAFTSDHRSQASNAGARVLCATTWVATALEDIL